MSIWSLPHPTTVTNLFSNICLSAGQTCVSKLQLPLHRELPERLHGQRTVPEQFFLPTPPPQGCCPCVSSAQVSAIRWAAHASVAGKGQCGGVTKNRLHLLFSRCLPTSSSPSSGRGRWGTLYTCQVRCFLGHPRLFLTRSPSNYLPPCSRPGAVPCSLCLYSVRLCSSQWGTHIFSSPVSLLGQG